MATGVQQTSTNYLLTGFDSKKQRFSEFPPSPDYPADLITPIYVPEMANRPMTPVRVWAAAMAHSGEVATKIVSLCKFYDIDDTDIDAGLRLAIALAGAHVPGMKFSFRRPPKDGKGPVPTAERRADRQWHDVQETKAKEGFKHDIQAIRHLMKTGHALFDRGTEEVIAQRVKEAKKRAVIAAAAAAAETAAFRQRIANLIEQAEAAASRTRRIKPRKSTK